MHRVFLEGPGKKTYSREVLRVVEALQRHSEVPKIFSNGQPEVTLTWRNERYDILCKARIDWLGASGNTPWVADLKTAPTLGIWEDSQADIVQPVFYMDAVSALYGQPCTFVFVVVEATPPHQIQLYEPYQEALYEARRLINDGMQRYKHEFGGMT